jgi:hypothetical protein
MNLTQQEITNERDWIRRKVNELSKEIGQEWREGRGANAERLRSISRGLGEVDRIFAGLFDEVTEYGTDGVQFRVHRLSDKTREYIANAEAKRAKAEAAWQDATADVQSYAVGESGPEDVYLPSAPDYTDVLERIATALEAAQKPQPGWQMDVTYAGGKPVKTLTLWTDTNKPVDKSNPRFTMTVADVEVAAA